MNRVARLFPFRRRVPLEDAALAERYAQSHQGQIVIPIHLASVHSLLVPFERFSLDPNSPAMNLNPELVEYLFRRVSEIPGEEMLLRFHLAADAIAAAIADDGANSPLDAAPGNAALVSLMTLQEALQAVIHQHFAYLAEVKKQNLQRLVRDAVLLSLLGLGALSLSIPLDALAFPDDAGISLHLLGQGVTVFGWLTLWESLVNLLWTWRPVYRQLKLCQQLQQVVVQLNRAT